LVPIARSRVDDLAEFGGCSKDAEGVGCWNAFM
jgi:hypothetical protein